VDVDRVRASRSTAVIYSSCPVCGATTLVAFTYILGNVVEMDVLPIKDGNLSYDPTKNEIRVVIPKFQKFHKKEKLWKIHYCAS
jgi:hypothetical protein